jgi:hypothetical protein
MQEWGSCAQCAYVTWFAATEAACEERILLCDWHSGLTRPAWLILCMIKEGTGWQ